MTLLRSPVECAEHVEKKGLLQRYAHVTRSSINAIHTEVLRAHQVPWTAGRTFDRRDQQLAMLELKLHIWTESMKVMLEGRQNTQQGMSDKTYLTASKYPALVAAWDNDDDDVYNSL